VYGDRIAGQINGMAEKYRAAGEIAPPLSYNFHDPRLCGLGDKVTSDARDTPQTAPRPLPWSQPASPPPSRPLPLGNDKKGDGSAVLPWRSIQHGVDRMKPGDTLIVDDGSYAPFHVDRDDASSDKRLVIRGASTGAIIRGYEVYDDRYTGISVLGSYVSIENLVVNVGAADNSLPSRGIRVSGKAGDYIKGVRITGNRVSNAGWVGITTSYAKDVVIEGNKVWGSKGQHGIYVANSADNPRIIRNVSFFNRQAGIQVNADPEMSGDGIITGAVIARNNLYLNGTGGSAALNLASVRDSLIFANLLYDNHSQGIANWDDEAGDEYGCKNNLYLNNTVVMPAGSRHTLSLRHGSTGNQVFNNILLHRGNRDSIAVDMASFPGLESDHNILIRLEDVHGRLISLEKWQKQSGNDLNSLVASPAELFRDPDSHDYHLKESSPAIGRGKPVPGTETNIDGLLPSRNRMDIGAYQYQPASDPAQETRSGTP